MNGPGLEVVAIAGCGLAAAAAAFQAALALGAPWGASAYGGRAVLADGRLPTRFRASSGVTAAVLLTIGCLLLLRGGVVGGDSGSTPLVVACWAFAVLFALNTAGNLAGRSRIERWGMGGVTAVLTVVSVLLALG